MREKEQGLCISPQYEKQAIKLTKLHRTVLIPHQYQFYLSNSAFNTQILMKSESDDGDIV